jgi:hypothetical protein
MEGDDQVEHLIRLLEWVMVLPEVLEERYEQFLEEVKREQNTPYLSVLERKALREGWEQVVQKGLQEGILTLLRTLYGAVPAELGAQLRAIRDIETLNALYPLALSAGSLEKFAQQLAQQLGEG